jgi:hypothetical protein
MCMCVSMCTCGVRGACACTYFTSAERPCGRVPVSADFSSVSDVSFVSTVSLERESGREREREGRMNRNEAQGDWEARRKEREKKEKKPDRGLSSADASHYLLVGNGASKGNTRKTASSACNRQIL